MPELRAHQQSSPEKWQPERGSDGSRSFCLPIWVHVERQPELGLNVQCEWVVPTGDVSIPAQRKPVLLLPLLRLERDAFEMQISAKLEALKLPVLSLMDPLVLLTLKAGLSSRSDFWEIHALKWIRRQDITEQVLDLVLYLKNHGSTQRVRHQALHFLKGF